MNILQKAIRSMYPLTGSFNEKLLKYYKQYGATSSVLQDAEKQYLVGRLGNKYYSNQDYWKELDSQFGDGLPLEVSDILRKYGNDAHLYLPGIGRVNGFEAGNYFDSAGTTHASVDGSVGAVLDAAGSVGAYVVVGGDFSSAAQWSSIAGFTVASGSLSINAGGGAITNNAGASAVIGKTYKIDFDVPAFTSGQIKGFMGGQGGVAANAVGHYTSYVTATTTDKPQIYVTSGGTICQVDNLIVREVSGIHATQSTPGFKPTLRSVAGRNYLEFDGVDDRLSSTGSFVVGSGATFVFAGMLPTLGSYRFLFGQGTNGCAIFIGPNGEVGLVQTGGGGVFSGNGTIVAGQAFVLTMKLSVSGGVATGSIRKNGVIATSGSFSLNTGAFASGNFSLFADSGGSACFKGTNYQSCIVASELSTQDVQLLEKQAASIAGIQL